MEIATLLPYLGGSAATVLITLLVGLEVYKKFKAVTNTTTELAGQTDIVNLLREELDRRHTINLALEEKVDELRSYCNKLETTLRRIEVQLEECERHRKLEGGAA